MSDQKGQAALEYILLLSVSVLVILGAIYQFNDAFRKFTKSYFGDYVTCLLEAGELPGVQRGVCETNYKPFSITEGRPLIGEGVVPGAGTSGDAGSDGVGGNNKKGSANRSDGGGQTEKSDPSIRATASSGGGVGSGGKFKGTDSLNAAVARNAKGSSVNANDDETSEASGSRGYSSYQSGATRSTTSAFDKSLGRLRFIPQNKDEKEDDILSTSQNIEITDADKKRMRGGLVSSQRQNRQDLELDMDTGFSLPNLLRYFLIAAIILVIVLFLGGQAMALKKGQEKG